MNKQGQIEIIRQACIKANPEITELKFGCRVKLKEKIQYQEWGDDDKFTFVGSLGGGQIADTGEFDEFTMWLKADDEIVFSIDYEPEWKIIGRPITLADVLLALHRKSEFYVVSTSGLFMPLHDINPNGENIFWDLLHDNLELQSEETIKFLAELL